MQIIKFICLLKQSSNRFLNTHTKVLNFIVEISKLVFKKKIYLSWISRLFLLTQNSIFFFLYFLEPCCLLNFFVCRNKTSVKALCDQIDYSAFYRVVMLTNLIEDLKVSHSEIFHQKIFKRIKTSYDVFGTKMDIRWTFNCSW